MAGQRTFARRPAGAARHRRAGAAWDPARSGSADPAGDAGGAVCQRRRSPRLDRTNAIDDRRDGIRRHRHPRIGDRRDHHLGIVRNARRHGGQPPDRRSPALCRRWRPLYRQPVPPAFSAARAAGRRDRRRHRDANLRIFRINRQLVLRYAGGGSIRRPAGNVFAASVRVFGAGGAGSTDRGNHGLGIAANVVRHARRHRLTPAAGWPRETLLYFVGKGSRLERGDRQRRMSLYPDDRSPGAPIAARRGSLRATIVAALAMVFVGAAVGFVGFLSQLRGAEVKPERTADGIVVLTGGSSRVSDAMELLAGGFGKRLLISGVHPTNAASDISRSLSDNQSLLSCCVDLDRSAVNTRSNAAETRRWARDRGFKSLIVVTSNYHMPRAIVELSHAMPGVALIPFAVGGDKWRDEPWWTSGATLRLLLSEYVKYVAAEVRVRLADAGLELTPELADQPTGLLAPRTPATAQAN